MNNLLPQKYSNTNFFKRFIFKIKYWFKKNIPEDKNESNIYTYCNTDFANNLKVDIASQSQKSEQIKFMENLNSNPELLEKLSNDRLEKLLQYYIDENNKKRESIKKLTLTNI